MLPKCPMCGARLDYIHTVELRFSIFKEKMLIITPIGFCVNCKKDVELKSLGIPTNRVHLIMVFSEISLN